MNKYILMLGVAGVVLGSYCAYAGNSATMTVTTTITHDVSLTKTDDLNMGTVTVNPAADWSEGGQVTLATDGTGMSSKSGNITAYSGFSIGTFTASVSDSCKVDGIIEGAATSHPHPCFRINTPLSTVGNTTLFFPRVIYDSGNKFKFQFDSIQWNAGTIPQSGTFDEDIVIEYIL
ncbi:MAG: hypothetical protein IJ689_04090 [Alphaproteobacteria bacterium]|nr:hypothetical protein [Alphaproteobacteria bacterium]